MSKIFGFEELQDITVSTYVRCLRIRSLYSLALLLRPRVVANVTRIPIVEIVNKQQQTQERRGVLKLTPPPSPSCCRPWIHRSEEINCRGVVSNKSRRRQCMLGFGKD